MATPFEPRFAGRAEIVFAVVGDLHYVKSADASAPQSARDYYETNRSVSLPLLDRLKEQRPDFILHTGDIVEGHLADETTAAAEVADVIERFSAIAPTFFARGNHDAHGPTLRAYTPLIREHHSRLLGRTVAQDHFAFSAGPARVIVTDTFCRGREAEQLAWLRAELTASRSAARRFVAGHGPLFPIGRPYFTHLEFARGVAGQLYQTPVDAYFCGHTHNQIVSLHDPGTGGAPVLQCVGSLVGTFARERTVPIALARNLASRGERVDCLWGVLEGGWPSWYLVRASGSEVALESYYASSPATLTRGALRWRRPGTAEVEATPELPAYRALREGDLASIRRAWLHLAGYAENASGKRARLNGQPIGALPPLGAFAPRRIPVPAALLARLAAANELVIDDPNGEIACVGGLQLELELQGGERIFSRPHPHLYATSERYGTRDHTAVRHVAPGRFGPIALEF